MTLSMRLLPHVSVGLLALVLAGCGGGGDDGNPLDEARAERDAALAAQMAAETAQMEAETAQMEAEAAQAAAEAAQMVAEMAREEAVNERDIAQAAEMTAMAAQAAAETARDAAMAAQMTADTARQMAEDARVAAEADRDNAQLQREAAMTAQMAAEADRDAAVAAQQMADTARIAAEADRDAALASAASAMAAQTAAEADRDAAVAAQAAAVAARDEARAAQVTAETAEALAEAARMEAEAERDIAQAAATLATATQAAAEAARDAAQADRDATQAQLIATEAARDSARAERDLAQTQLAALQTDRDRLRDDLTQAQADNRIQMARIQTLEDDIADLDAEIADLEADVEDRDGQIALLRSEKEGLQSDLIQAQADNRIHMARIQDLDDDIVALNGRIDDLEGDVDDRDDQIAALTTELEELKDRQSEGNLMASQSGHLIHVNRTDEGVEETDDPDDTLMFGEEEAMGGFTRVSHGQTGGRIVVVDNDMVLERAEVRDADDADDTPTPYSRGSAPMSGGTGWYGYTFNQTVAGGAGRQRVVYTNIEAPATESFATAYGGLSDANTGFANEEAILLFDFANRTNADGNIEFLDEDGDVVAIRFTEEDGTFRYEDDDEMAIQPAAIAAAAQRTGNVLHSGDFQGEPKPGFPDLPPLNRAGGEDDTNYLMATDAVGSRSTFWSRVRFDTTRLGNYYTDSTLGQLGFRTTYDGVPGELRCAGDAGTCLLGRTGENDDGVEYYSSPQDWVFVADNASSNVATRRLDGDYLTIGWWIEEPVDAAGTYRFARFVTGMDLYRGDITTVTGSATYKGPAVGIWTERVRELETAHSGTFRADAELTAVFDDEDVVADDQDMIGGTITNFMLDNGASRNWRVMLDDVGTGDIAGATNTTSGSADGREWSGRWNGNFYGNGGTRQTALQQPGHVAGEFRASFGTPEIGPEMETGQGTPTREGDEGFVGVSGVFGATRQQPD